LGENGAWAHPGTVQIFWVPPIISGMGKATDFEFGGYIYRANPNKSPLKILEKRERGRIQGLLNFLLLVVALSFESESKLQTKIIMSEYVVRQWLFIDIEKDDLGQIDFF